MPGTFAVPTPAVTSHFSFDIQVFTSSLVLFIEARGEIMLVPVS